MVVLMSGSGKVSGFLWGLIFFALISGEVSARVHGVCSGCHTMHYSQGGLPLSEWGASGPYKALLVNDCVGCHTGKNTESTKTPYILTPESEIVYGATGTETTSNTLAGGNFWWVYDGNSKRFDAKGHNVEGIALEDETLHNAPPGGTDMKHRLTCAGTYGCHGDRAVVGVLESMMGAHHADDSTIDGSSVGKSYRFLNGIVGLEDPDWEYRPTNTEHNQYKGIDRSDEQNYDPTTISHLCAECHGDFHFGNDISSGSWGSPWLRHPTDYDMGHTASNSEYRNYPGPYGQQGDYSVVAPVASENVTEVKSSVKFDKDTIITCITCHRAHGTPYWKLLRWDYFGWPTDKEDDTNGCMACHSAKN